MTLPPFAQFKQTHKELKIVCDECKVVFTQMTEDTRPRTFVTCPCGRSSFDWGDGYYTRSIGKAKRL